MPRRTREPARDLRHLVGIDIGEGEAQIILLTRAEPSVLRAAVMSGLAMVGIFLGRPRAAPAIVGGAVLILLAGVMV